MIIYSGTQYFVITFSIRASPTSSDLAWCMGTVIKWLVTSSIMHKMNICPLYHLGMTFKSMLSLDKVYLALFWFGVVLWVVSHCMLIDKYDILLM